MLDLSVVTIPVPENPYIEYAVYILDSQHPVRTVYMVCILEIDFLIKGYDLYHTSHHPPTYPPTACAVICFARNDSGAAAESKKSKTLLQLGEQYRKLRIKFWGVFPAIYINLRQNYGNLRQFTWELL